MLLRPGLFGVEVGECLEIGVESWLLEPVPLAEERRGEERRGEGRRGEGRGGGVKEEKKR